MLYIVLSLVLAVVAFGVLKREIAGTGRMEFSGFDGVGVLVGFTIVFGGAIALGPKFGIPLLFALLLHEAGQVLAYRILGHENPRFRLVPWFSRDKISDTEIKSDGEAFLAAIMGPALGLGPMLISISLAAGLATSQPEIANWFWLLGSTIGAVNFISLLPFLPLNGGRCTAAAVRNFWPALAPAMTVFMCAAMASASLRTGSVALMIMAGIGAQGLLRKVPSSKIEMSSDDGLIAMAAYAFTLAAHFSAGWLLFDVYF